MFSAINRVISRKCNSPLADAFRSEERLECFFEISLVSHQANLLEGRPDYRAQEIKF
jgi:hypothetical protein